MTPSDIQDLNDRPTEEHSGAAPALHAERGVMDARIQAVAEAINNGQSATDCYRALGFPSRSAVLGFAHRQGFSFGRPVTEAMLAGALTPKPSRPILPKPLRTTPMDDQSPISALAGELLDEHRIAQAALPSMMKAVLTSEDLREMIFAELAEGICRRVLEAEVQRRYQAEKRQTGGGPIAKPRGHNIQAHARAVASSLLEDFVLPGGKKLGDATRTDLQRALYAYQIHVTDAASKAKFVRLIMQSVTGDATVRECVKPERAAELRELAQREAAALEA
jgi:hypothetical protein